MSDRSIDGIPSVKVNFADGSSDYLVLSKYENMDGHFIGHLAKENTACVAMVDHPEHAELTIMSDRTVESTMYKWKNNGEVELIPEVFSNYQEMDFARKVGSNDDNDVLVIKKEMKKQDKIEKKMKKLTVQQSVKMPRKNKLQLQVKCTYIYT